MEAVHINVNVSKYDVMREMLDVAQRFIDRGMAQTAQEYTWLVMARALVDIADTLNGMTTSEGELLVIQAEER